MSGMSPRTGQLSYGSPDLRGAQTPQGARFVSEPLAVPTSTSVGSGGGALAIPSSPSASRSQYQVGDRVEYWSDSYRQWMPGVVTRVREGGQILDLDVKKGAQASKLRKERRSPRPSATQSQARQLQAEISQVTRSMRDNPEWAELSGEDMISRAGAVTVRKMVETTKALLQGLEGTLIRRAGFLAGIFHMWRCTATLLKVERIYQDRMFQHHNEWGQHLDLTKGHYESELLRMQHYAEERRSKFGRQQELVLEKWLKGDKLGLLQEVWRVWRQFAKTEKSAEKRKSKVMLMAEQWVEGKVKGTAHAGLKAWHALAAHEKMVRKRDEEMAKALLSKDSEAEKARKKMEFEFQEKLRMLEQKHKDRSSNVEVIVSQWEKGSAKGMRDTCWRHWRQRATDGRHREGLQLQMRKWAEGNEKGLRHSTFLNWRNLSQDAHRSREGEALRQEKNKLEKMLADQVKAHNDLLEKHMSEQERHKREAKAAITTIIKKWEMGKAKGLLSSCVTLWRKEAKDSKKSGRARQAVHLAMTKFFEGDAKANRHVAFLSWKGLAKSEKHVRDLENQAANADARWQQYELELEAHRNGANSAQEELRAKAHAAVMSSVERWTGGNRKGSLRVTLQAWANHIKVMKDNRKRHNAVRDSLLRAFEGEARGIKASVFSTWHAGVAEMKAHRAGQSAGDERVARLEAQLKGLMDKHLASLTRYAEMLGSKQGPVLKGMTFTAWKNESFGLKEEGEADRKHAAAVAEMERHRQMADTLHKERRLRALDAMGLKRANVLAGVVFEAWAYLWEKTKDENAYKLNHNEAMMQYSEFILGQTLKKDKAALLAAVFSEWHREGKIMSHEMRHAAAATTLEGAYAEIDALNDRALELQDQCAEAYQQIEHITATLQKEIQTKEELTEELRKAYRQKASATTPTRRHYAGVSDQVSRSPISRHSSEETLQDGHSPLVRQSSAPAGSRRANARGG
eukprot:CAMPEP_0206422720 /NCGR_PEP_ID=MMETSP0324_2-20121206/2257_1 /ASSEMBLY_ACC=CAM_ASM_000836 /TAXON_ID=2866 /ORGANISM="Crypthecodinium cohnii, Strain Seligo" /LENGTH=967 /DNA_ID=CAMNT_0053887151 /DNA_START=481 /DNA_END=3380 /DNA_ORIENTATION=+